MAWHLIEQEGERQIVEGDIVEPCDGPSFVTGHEGWAILETHEEKPEDPGEIAVIEAALCAAIDAGAAAARAPFLTLIPGQERIYLLKEAEARDVLAEGAGPWPLLAAEAAALDATISARAAAVLAEADACIARCAAIEAARVAAKASVRAAETADSKRAAAAVDWAAVTSAPEDEE